MIELPSIPYHDKALVIDPKNTFALTNKDAILDRLGNNTTLGNTKSNKIPSKGYSLKAGRSQTTNDVRLATQNK
jgi:hypothetical protein